MYKKVFFIMMAIISLFSFNNVNAKVSDVSIKSVEQIEKNGNLEERSKVSFNGMNINFDLGFYEVNDSVKYRVTLQNKGEEDIYINNKGLIDSSEYITYDYIWNDNNNLIKGNNLKTFDILVTYKNPINENKFQNGRYIEDKNFSIKISDEKEVILPATNPKTDSNLSIFIILFSIEILIVLAVIVYLIKNKKLNLKTIRNIKKVNMISIFLFTSFVLITIIGYSYALEVAEVKTNLNIKVYRTKMARSCLSDSYLVEKSGYCIDWNSILPMADGKVENAKIITTKSKNIDSTYMLDGVQYNLDFTKDVSNLQNGEVNLGVYTSSKNKSTKLLIIGENGGVIAPVDSSWLFGAYFEKDVVDGQEEKDISSYKNVFEIPKSTLNNNRTPQMNAMLTVNSLDLSNFYVGDTSNTSGMFAYNGYVSYDGWSLLGMNSWDTSNVVDTSFMFWNAAALSNSVAVPNLNMLDTSKVKNMEAMFMKTAINTSMVSLDISNWNVSSVIDMSRLFNGAFNGIQNFDISKWNVSSVTNMSSIFNDAFKMVAKFDISNWNVSSVTNMNSMFKSSFYILPTFDISNWDVSKVSDMNYMFHDAFKNLSKLNLSKWDVSSVNDAVWMFYNAFEYSNEMNLNLSTWEVENVQNMRGMFSKIAQNAQKVVADLSNWAPSLETDLDEMFNAAFSSAQELDLYLNRMELYARREPSHMFSSMPTARNVKIYLKDEFQIAAIHNYKYLGTAPWGWNNDNLINVKNG